MYQESVTTKEIESINLNAKSIKNFTKGKIDKQTKVFIVCFFSAILLMLKLNVKLNKIINVLIF